MALSEFIDDDLAAMLSVDDFARTVTYTPFGGAPVQVDGILRGTPIDPAIGAVIDTHSQGVTFVGRKIDMPNAGIDDTIVDGSTTYRVDRQPYDRLDGLLELSLEPQ